jgi:hypothetical protein
MKILAVSLTLLIVGAAAAAQEKTPKPTDGTLLRVMIFAGGPTREFHFVRRLLLRDPKKVHLSICLQTASAESDLGVEPDGVLADFPLFSAVAQKGRAYDLIVAIDPDWSRVPPIRQKALEDWVNNQGGGLILVAGPVHTFRLARPPDGFDVSAVKRMLPVHLRDTRLHAPPGSDVPRPLRLTDPSLPVLQLDAKSAAGAGWKAFFWQGARPDDAKKIPLRGFFGCYPVDGLTAGAQVLAYFVDRFDKEHPFLVARPHGKGNVVFVGSGELWRLRTYRPAYHERIWWNLAQHAAPEASSFTPQSLLTVRAHAASQGQSVSIEARLLDMQGKPIDPDTAPVVRVKGPGRGEKAETTVNLKPRPERGTGWFEASILLAEPGDYTLAIAARGLSLPLSSKFRVKSLFEIQIGDGELLVRQSALSGRSIPWSVAVLALARSMAAAKGDAVLAQEAQLYRDAIQSTVADRWSVRHEALAAALRRCPDRKLADLRAAHEESQAIAERLRTMRVRLLGNDAPDALGGTLEQLRKWTATEDAIESALAKAEPGQVEEQLRLWGLDPVEELTPQQAKSLASTAADLGKALDAYRTRVKAAHDIYCKTLKEVSSRRIRPETMRFLEDRARASLSQFLDKQYSPALDAVHSVERTFADKHYDVAQVRKAHAQLDQFRTFCGSMHVDRVSAIFDELIHLESQQREQTRIMAELRKQLEAELLQELGEQE